MQGHPFYFRLTGHYLHEYICISYIQSDLMKAALKR